MGYDYGHWSRKVMDSDLLDWFSRHVPETKSALEISGDRWAELSFKSYRNTSFPEFDVCESALPETFDVIIADTVFEHVRFPHRATQNVLNMLRHDGHFVITVPFMFPLHNVPIDCWRWTEEGLRNMLIESGFADRSIQTNAWGNVAVFKASLSGKWPKVGWRGERAMRNDPRFPVMVWAYAKKE